MDQLLERKKKGVDICLPWKNFLRRKWLTVYRSWFSVERNIMQATAHLIAVW